MTILNYNFKNVNFWTPENPWNTSTHKYVKNRGRIPLLEMGMRSRFRERRPNIGTMFNKSIETR